MVTYGNHTTNQEMMMTGGGANHDIVLPTLGSSEKVQFPCPGVP